MVDGLDFANVAIDTSPGKRPFMSTVLPATTCRRGSINSARS